MPKNPSKKQGAFESSLKRLEAIVEELEKGNIPLEDCLKLYEEGIQLSKQCLETLNKAEIRLKRLSKDMEGKFKLFDEEEEA
jgi:exodeoxyribonuclease VII small subunit